MTQNLLLRVKKMQAKSLLGKLIEVRRIQIEDEPKVIDFERTVLYKQCFSKAHGVNIVGTWRSSILTLLSLWNNAVVGVLQIFDTRLTQFKESCVVGGYIIVNFCVHNAFRSYGVGRSMLQTSLILMQNENMYIAINKKEPLNDSDKLYRFYYKFGFTNTIFNDGSFILLQQPRPIKLTGELRGTFLAC